MRKFQRIVARLRRVIADRLPGRLPRLYSALDFPTEVEVQAAAYRLATGEYIKTGDRVLDVGFGLGYGLAIMAEKAGELRGIEVDRRAVSRGRGLNQREPKIVELRRYDGRNIPYDTNTFDVVTCIDVIEHVPDYMNLIGEMIRVSRRVVLLSTPNRRPEYTRPDGRPENVWHLREWSFRELREILERTPDVSVEWNFLDGEWEGPFRHCSVVSRDTIALAPALMVDTPRVDCNQ